MFEITICYRVRYNAPGCTRMLTRPENSVASIARLLGVSRSTLYKHVPELSGGRTAVQAP